MNNNNSSKQILLSVLGVAILVVAVVGVSFAAFTYTGTGKVENKIQTGTITMTYTEKEDSKIAIDNAMPMSDEEGKKLSSDKQVFDFTVSANITGDVTINYAIAAEKISVDGPNPSQLDDQYVRLYLTETTKLGGEDKEVPTQEPKAFSATGPDETTGLPAGEMELLKSTFTQQQQGNRFYRLRMWVAENYVVTGVPASYKVKVHVYGKSVAQ